MQRKEVNETCAFVETETHSSSSLKMGRSFWKAKVREKSIESKICSRILSRDIKIGTKGLKRMGHTFEKSVTSRLTSTPV